MEIRKQVGNHRLIIEQVCESFEDWRQKQKCHPEIDYPLGKEKKKRK